MMECDIYDTLKMIDQSQDSFLDTIKPLLVEGREAELCEWMKEIGLLVGSMKCPTPTCNGLEMQWKKARIIDKFNWLCTECKKKVPIKTGSFMEEFQCSVKASVETMLAWCNNVNPEDVVIDGKTMKTSLVRRIYGQCTSIADWYIQNHPELSQLGGENAVVLVDIFPDGSMTTAPHNNNYSKTILCVADTAHMPARVWAQVVDNDLHKDYSRLLAVVLSHVRPMSTLVVTPRLFPDMLQYAKGMAEVISVEALMSLDPDDYQRSLKNLETIWATTVSACQEVQQMSSSETIQLLRELQWRQVFTSHTKYLFQHIVEHQHAKGPVVPSPAQSGSP
ncbi:uncharacterized protein LOC124367781 [Homalodisca vitripennis]|nr:uncharacterized protein LOC124367781 [Homalodisca vitripennis]KAG8276806.1 hypothetical protein J6590_056172 [Homalodisca vitripennis]